MSNSKNYDSAIALYQVGKYEESIQFYDFELALNNQNYLAYLGRAKSKIHLQNTELALQDFSQCLALVPKSQYLSFFKGILGFLKENRQDSPIDELILSQFSKLPWHDKMQFLMQCVLQKKIKKGELVVSNFSDQEKKKAINEIKQNVQLSEDLKKDVNQLFLNYFETFREEWFNKITAEREKVALLEKHFPAAYATYDNLEKSLSLPFKNARLAVSVLEKTNVFITQELPVKLQQLGQKERLAGYESLYNSNKQIINSHFEKAKQFKELVSFANSLKGLRAGSLRSAKQLVSKIDNLPLKRNGLDQRVLQSAIDRLPGLNESIDETQSGILDLLDQKFDNLLLEEDYKAAQRIALKVKPFFPGVEKYNGIASLKITKTKKRKKKLLIYSSITAFILIAGYFSFVYYQEIGDYNEAIETNTFEAYETFEDRYPNSSYLPEISQKKELILYENALKSGTLSELEGFIEAYPNSEFLVEMEVTQLQTSAYTASNEIIPVKNQKIVNLKGATMYFTTPSFKIVWFTVSQPLSILGANNKPSLMTNGLYYCNQNNTSLLSTLKNPTTIALAAGEPLQYLGEKSETLINFNSNGNYINEFFYRCSDQEGNVGWVNESALGEILSNKTLTLADYNPNYSPPLLSSTNHQENSIEEVDEPVVAPVLEEEISTTIADQEITCPNCNGKKLLTSSCATSGCLGGQISVTCGKCGGDYKNKSKLCPKCAGKGCSYCGGDGLACNKCDKGVTGAEKHALCNGTGKISKSCSTCKGTGVVKN